MHWKEPPRIKVYEALGAIADARLAITEEGATITSSSGNKTYTVTYNPEEGTIVANDNGSYYQRYMGYPMIAYLLHTGAVDYEDEHAQALKSIAWKDVAQELDNDWNAVEEYAEQLSSKRGVPPTELRAAADEILADIENLGLKRPRHLPKPPEGY